MHDNLTENITKHTLSSGIMNGVLNFEKIIKKTTKLILCKFLYQFCAPNTTQLRT